MKKFTQFLCVIVAIVVPLTLSSPAFAQKGGPQPGGQKQGGGKGMKGGNKGGTDKANGKESPAAHLPPGFQQLSKDEVKQLDGLCLRCLRWIADARQSRKSSPLSVSDYFGSMEAPQSKKPDGNAKKPEGNDGNSAAEISETDIGFYVLSRLSDKQRSQLGRLLVGQRADISEYEKLRSEVQTQLLSLNADQAPEREFERAIADVAKRAGELEIRIALAQAKEFAEVAKSVTPEQSEFLMLLRVNPAAVNANNESISEVRATLAKHDIGDQETIAVLAYRLACYCTGTAAQNAAAAPDKNAGLLGNQSAGGDKEGQTTARFLSSLNPTQQKQIYQLLGNQVRTNQTQLSRRAQIIVALDAMKSGKAPIEAKLRQLGSQIAETDAQSAVAEARAFQSIRKSLTAIQTEFIQQNLARAGK